MNLYVATFAITACLFFTNCKSQQEKQTAQKNAVEYQAEKEFGSPLRAIQIIPNSDKTLSLCIDAPQKGGNGGPQALKFFVYDGKTQAVVYSSSVLDGEVVWENSTQLRITQQQGTVQGDGNGKSVALYDVVSKQMSTPATSDK